MTKERRRRDGGKTKSDWSEVRRVYVVHTRKESGGRLKRKTLQERLCENRVSKYTKFRRVAPGNTGDIILNMK